MWKNTNAFTYSSARQRAREMRKQQTRAETHFWARVRRKSFRNLKFFRQHPIMYCTSDKKSYFIADFYCSTLKLIVEIDGSVHDFRTEEDAVRTKILEAMGYHIIRFRNEEVLADCDSILNRLDHFITTLSREK